MENSTSAAPVRWSIAGVASVRVDREVERLDALLGRGRADHQMYCACVPGLSGSLIERYSRLRPVEFARVLEVLAEYAGEEPPWDLCDELARFYAAVFARAACREQRERALVLLLALGAREERYAVADVVRAVLWTVRDREEIECARAAIERSPHAWWYAHPHTLRGPLPGSVAEALARAVRARSRR
jgi:hypothetical protein